MRNGLGKLGTVTVVNLGIVVLCILLLSLGALKVLSDQLYDFNMKQTMSGAPHEDIIVIGIDEESIKEVGPYPWDRKVYAKLINQLEGAGVRAIGFDVEFDSESNFPESDKVLADELAKHSNIIIPSHAMLEDDFKRATKTKAGELLMARSVTEPIAAFRKSVQPAHVNAAFDTDGVIRSNWLELSSPQGVFPSMGYKMAQLGGADVRRFQALPQLEDRPKAEMLIRWDAGEYDFETIPFAKVLKGAVPAQTFKDRLVLVGYTAPGYDEGITPIEKHMHLVYAHANILNQILKQQVIQPVSKTVDLTLAFVVALLFGLLTWRVKAITGVIMALCSTLVILAGQYVLFSANLHFLDVIGALACGWIAYLGNLAMKTYFETKQKMYITKQFGRYISPDLVKEIASSEQEIQLGGISKELSVLFLDVRGFTPLSEKLKPEEVVDFLNMMFNLITERVLANHGTIDKFIGDAAMILFNAPLDVPDHPYYAVKTAYEIQLGMEQVRADVLQKYGVTISVGIGINTGEVVVGNIGSYLRVDYTAIGDNVNTAARIESNTQPNQILVSEATYELTKEYFGYHFAGEKLMKGKSMPLKLFEVLSVKGAPSSVQESKHRVS
ncbi:CHASE2 domain-containing protein [Paenibacillus cremeus]|uniref:CHASE2 domain-containing protein n=1 Tax=Paenibacillus cremeus TaxID=2163881 RepID=UPI0021BD5BD6|nr:adenylate/guanylate cyclase domain-containing protein [Paenibacillus cremeus]